MSDESSPLADDTISPPNADPNAADDGAVWYFRQQKQAFGPVSFAQLRRRIGAGKVKPSDPVRRKGEAAWRRADAVPNLCTAEAEQESEQAAVPPAKRRETATVDAADALPAQKAARPARKKSRAPLVLAFLALAVVLVVVILAAGIAAYLIYDKLKVNGPANPVAAAVVPRPPGLNPMMPLMPGKDAPFQVDQAKPVAPPVQPKDDPVPKGDAPQPPQPPPPQPPPPPPQGDPAQAQVVPDGAAGFVFMEAPEAPAEVHADHYYWILLREIVRQSLLLGAREELGLTTRDAVLGEAPPPGMPAKNLLRATSRFQMNKLMDLAMTNGPRASAGTIVTATGPIKSITYGDMMMTLEQQTRSRIPQGLRKVGFTGKANRFLPMDNATPDGIEDLLGQMNFTAQYQAVRALHAQMREQGESPGNLGALVRAYANLGVLTEFHWDSASKVFKARSLLYAGRLTARVAKEAPLGHWHCGYAYALCGLHTPALLELNHATKLHKEGKGKDGKEPGFTTPPPWLDLIDAYCRFDTAYLKKAAAEAKSARLAQLLWFFSVESTTCPQLTVAVGESVLETNPECYRVYDGICRIGGLGARQVGTQRAPAVFAEQFPRRLADLPGVPPAAVKLAGDTLPELEQYRALRVAGDSADERREFSWSVLAHLARGARFAQLCQRLEFMRYMWTVPTAEYANEVLPSVAGHPYEPFIRSFTLDRAREADKCRLLLARLPHANVLPTQVGLLRAYEECKSPELYRVRFLAMGQTDLIDYDIRLSVPWATDHHPAELARLGRALFATSPHSPLGRGLMLKVAWNEVGKNAADWEKQAQHPVLLLMLGQSYLEQQRSEDAVRCIESAIAISPEVVAFKLLAAGHKIAGKTDKWQEALERYLALNPPGLEPARVRVDIAKELMRQKQWQKAKPFADTAAATGADWAMQCASECYEGLGQWEESEQWMRRSTERYENAYTRWFLWCKRTGRGDLAAATKVVTDRFQDVSQIANDLDMQEMAFFYTLTGKSEQAMWAFKAWYKAMPKGDVSSLMYVLALDETDEPALRDKILKNYPDRITGPLDWLPGLCRESLARGEKAKLDLDAAEKRIAATPAQSQRVACYFVARFLEQHGHKDDAIRYYRRCVDAPQVVHLVFPTLAINRLRALGVEKQP